MIAFQPQRLELLAVVLLHYHGAKERGDEQYGEDAACHRCPFALYEATAEWQEQILHQGNGCYAEYSVNGSVEAHGAEQRAPVGLCGE